MNELQILFHNTGNSIDEVVNCFYQQNNKDGFEKLDNVIVNISNLTLQILQAVAGTDDQVVIERDINNLLIQLMNAMENLDVVLISDLLKYELLVYFSGFFE